MQVSIVTFPATPVAMITHSGPPAQEHETVRKLIAWKIENRLTDSSRYKQYGLHHFPPEESTGMYRVDFCLSMDRQAGANPYGIVDGSIPELRCALARDVGSRTNNQAARFLYEKWLPASGELPAGFPAIFHYVNVGPHVRPEEAITDVYLPLK